MTTTSVPTRDPAETPNHSRNRRLLAGAATGPLFVAASFAQVPFRDGFHLRRHPYSFLLNGPGGALQTVNFLLLGAGFLVTATAIRAVVAGRRGRAIAACTAAVGVGQVVAGLFAPGGAYGYPAGAPDGRPEHVSSSGVVHGIGFAVSMLGWVALLVLLALALRSAHRRVAVLSAVAAAVLLAVPALSGRDDGATFIYLLVTPAFFVTSAVLVHLHRLARAGRIVR